jgi:hypothetical protein
MTHDELLQVRDALVKAHVYLLHLPGRMYMPDEGDDCRDYYCFACRALSAENHKDDCEVLKLTRQLSAARDIAILAAKDQP